MTDQIVSDELVELCATALAARWPKSKIKREIIYHVNDGKCARGTVEKILGMARALLRERAGVDRRDELADSINFLKDVIADETVDVKTRLNAQEQLSKMLGLGHEHGDKHKTPIEAARAIKLAQHAMSDSNDSAGS